MAHAFCAETCRCRDIPEESTMMKKLLLIGIAALLLATGTAHAETPEEYCLREYGLDNKAYDRCMREHHAYAIEERNSPYADKDYVWDCASYRWKWETRRVRTLAAACVQRSCQGNSQYYCTDGNLGYVPRKLRKIQLRDLGRVPRERYVKGK
jgi:hypothetical protein